MPKCLSLLMLSISFISSFLVYASPPNNYEAAKRVANGLFSSHKMTLYCGCDYGEDHKIDLASCNMQSAKPIKRARKLEWEHMMPAENFGRQLACWQEPICTDKTGKPYRGRTCCQRVSSEFREMEAELYNLWPSVGLINQARSDYRYAVLPWQPTFYGCDFRVDKSSRKVEPSNHAKGIVARANLFMAKKYKIQLSDAQKKLFEAWNKQFPPTNWELTWAYRVEEVEGYRNTYIS